MLSKNSIHYGLEVAKRLLSDNKLLIAKPNTLVSELNLPFTFTRLNETSLIKDDKGQTDIDRTVLSLIDSVNDPVFTTDQNNQKHFVPKDHDILTDNYVEDLKEILTHQFNYARSTVLKYVWQYHDEVMASMQNYLSSKTPENIFNVSFYELSPIYNSDYINFIVESSVKTTSFKIDNQDRFNFSSVFTENFNVVQYIASAMSEEDSKVIVPYLVAIGEDKIKSYILGNVLPYQLDDLSILEYFTVNAFFYQTLVSKQDLNLETSIAKLTVKSNYLKNVFASSMQTHLSHVRSQIASGRVIANMSKTSFSVMNPEGSYELVLFKENFDKILEEGASIEAIFGMIASASDYGKIFNSKASEFNKSFTESYVNRWNSVKKIYHFKLEADKMALFKTTLLNKFGTIYEQITKDGVEFKEGSISNYDKVTGELVKKYVQEINDVDFDNEKCTGDICLDIIAGIVFRTGQSYSILKKMNACLDKNSNLSASEAALFASIDYLTTFLVEQVSFK